MSSIKTDFHIHTSLSTDGLSSMEAMVEHGIRLGLTRLCFTEHMDYDNTYDKNPDGTDAFIVNMNDYLKRFRICKKRYENKIELLFGIELGLQEHLSDYYHTFIKKYPFDFVIGSSHLANGMDPYYEVFFENRSVKEAYTSYFEAILKNVTIHNDYDVYGHIDYVVRYGKESKEEFLYTYYADILDSILMTLIEKGKGIEVNTSGFKYDIGGLHPHISILKRYKELGGEILTIGSDAHETRHLAYKFDKAGSILRDCGFKHYTVFKDRKPEFLSL